MRWWQWRRALQTKTTGLCNYSTARSEKYNDQNLLQWTSLRVTVKPWAAAIVCYHPPLVFFFVFFLLSFLLLLICVCHMYHTAVGMHSIHWNSSMFPTQPDGCVTLGRLIDRSLFFSRSFYHEFLIQFYQALWDCEILFFYGSDTAKD